MYDLKYNNEPTRLVVGDDNVMREHCTMHRGTVQGRSVTTVGSHNLFMVNVHVAHDCIVGDNCMLMVNSHIAHEIAKHYGLTSIDDGHASESMLIQSYSELK